MSNAKENAVIRCYNCYHLVVCGSKDACENAEMCAQYVPYNKLNTILKENELLERKLSLLKCEKEAAVDCINEIEDALDRGNDNDWARYSIERFKNYIRELYD